MGTVIERFDSRPANRPFLVFDFRALWRSTLSAIVPESQKPIASEICAQKEDGYWFESAVGTSSSRTVQRTIENTRTSSG